MAISPAMSRRSFLLLFGAALLAEPTEAVIINGHSYVSLTGWAAANGFRRAGGDLWETIVFTNRASARLSFEKDSHTAEINGVNVGMSFPVAVDKGSFLIAQLDLAKAVEPLVFSPKTAGKKITTICLDPGHGGKDPGNRAGRNFEKTATLTLAGELSAQLKKAGFNVIQTRTKDQYVELPARPDLANRRHADLFVSLHFNGTASAQSTVRGAETYCITPVGASSSNAEGRGASFGATPANLMEKQSLLLAYQVQKALVNNLGVPDRSVRRARFAVLRDAEMPAIVVESGYLSHPVEGAKIFQPAYQQQIAAALVKGILSYQKLIAPPVPPAVTTKKVSTAKHSR